MNITNVSQYSDSLYESVLRLLPQLNSEIIPPTREFFKEILKSESIKFFIAETESKKIAGMLTLVSYPNVTGKKFWIEDVVVDDAYRGQGIGKQLIRSAMDHAADLGANEIKLTSRPSRKAANLLYRKLGFVLYETNVYKHKLGLS